MRTTASQKEARLNDLGKIKALTSQIGLSVLPDSWTTSQAAGDTSLCTAATWLPLKRHGVEICCPPSNGHSDSMLMLP